MSRPLPFRVGAAPVAAAITLRGSGVTLDREGRRVDAVVARDGAAIVVRAGERTARCVTARGPRAVWVSLEGRTWVFEIEHREPGEKGGSGAPDEIRAPMTGRVVAVAAAPGRTAREGDLLLTIEAMKMEFKLTAPEDGAVLEVLCAEGDRVDLGQLLVRLAPSGAETGGSASAPGAPTEEAR